MATKKQGEPPTRTFARDLAKMLAAAITGRYRIKVRELRAQLEPVMRALTYEQKVGMVEGPAKRRAIAIIEEWSRTEGDPDLASQLYEILGRNAERVHRHANNRLKANGVNRSTKLESQLFLEVTAVTGAKAMDSILQSRVNQSAEQLTKNLLAGKDLRQMMREAGRLANTMRRDAMFRARDIAGDVTAEVTERAFEQAGVKKWVWRSQGDTRVRPKHRELEGKVFKVGERHPTEGRPGDPRGCRCWAEPLVEGDAPVVPVEI